PPRPPRHLSFHPSGDTRAPPPFPTRRSSDLQPLAHGLPHRPRHVVMDVDVAPAPGHVRDVDPPAVQPRVQPAARDRVLVLVQAPDRKSTRLNSSHVAISYAVFCLKKKKKKTE